MYRRWGFPTIPNKFVYLFAVTSCGESLVVVSLFFLSQKLTESFACLLPFLPPTPIPVSLFLLPVLWYTLDSKTMHIDTLCTQIDRNRTTSWIARYNTASTTVTDFWNITNLHRVSWSLRLRCNFPGRKTIHPIPCGLASARTFHPFPFDFDAWWRWFRSNINRNSPQALTHSSLSISFVAGWVPRMLIFRF